MGNQPSIIQQIQKSVALPPPPSLDVQKATAQLELNMAKADVKSKQAIYDSLDPQSALKRKLAEGSKEANNYDDTISTKIIYETELFNTVYQELKTLSNNPSFMLAQKYKQELRKKIVDMEEENKKFKEAEHINKRRFLDANPHESVEGIYGFNSLDDRIYLLFWVCFLIFIFPISSYIINALGSKIGDSNTQTMVWITTIVLSCIFAHLALLKMS